jgi:molybdate transport system regulatory protein
MDEGRYRLRGRIWIESEAGTFIGYGRCELLERIRDMGSISAAARSMAMSYRHAWKLVDSMNRQSATPLVVSSTGGRGGGGAAVTEAGEKAIRAFREVYREHKAFLAARTGTLDL